MKRYVMGFLVRVVGVLIGVIVGTTVIVAWECRDGTFAIGRSPAIDSIPNADPNALVVLAYLGHRQGLTATTKWPRVAFAVGDGTLLLTAAHCVADFHDAPEQVVSTDIVVISPYYGDVFDFRIVAIDKGADVAILKAPWPSHPALALATEEELMAARRILLAGRPQTKKVSAGLQTELLPLSGLDGAAPAQALRARGTRRVTGGWSGSAMLIPDTGKVAGVLTQLDKRPDRRVLFCRLPQSVAMGCSVRSVYPLLGRHGLETAALGRPAAMESIPDSERAFSAAMACFQALFEVDHVKLKTSASELTHLRPRSVQAHLLAGIAALVAKGSSVVPGQEQFDFAESSYKKALEIDPNHAHARAIYGNLLIVRRCSAEALIQSEMALAVDPNNRLALFNRLALLPPEQRREAAERLVATEPNDPFGWFYYSNALLGLGEKEEALRAAQRAVDLDPNGLFYGGLAHALARLGRRDEAQECYKRMAERCGCDSCWYRYAAFLAGHRPDEIDEALEAVKKAESKAHSGKVSQKDIDVLKLQILEKKLPEEAEAQARVLLEADPNDAHGWWFLAGILRTLDKHPQAVMAAEKAVSLDPDASYQPRLANCLVKAGRPDEAQKTYDEMLERHSGRPRYWFWYARFLADSFPERLEEAYDALAKAVSGSDAETPWSVPAAELKELQVLLDSMAAVRR